MELEKYASIEDIDTNTYQWTCRVRAQVIWKGINRETNQFWGMNIIFLDDSNNRIHAFINCKFVDNEKEQIQEGEIYELSNFKVKEYVGTESCRAVRNEKHIFFTEHTQCKLTNSTGLQIEKYAFDFVPIQEISAIATDNHFLIDVAGFVRNTKLVVSSLKNQVETRRLMFDLWDGRFTIPVTLFNEFGDECETKLDESSNETVVMILAAAKISSYDGKINLTNYPATRMYLNPDHYCVAELKKRMQEIPTLDISSDEDDKAPNVPKFYSIAELRKLGYADIKKDIHVQVTVKRVDEKAPWYFARCARCNVEIERMQRKYRCHKCKRVIPHPDKRFRVFTICYDGKSSAGIIFPDTEIRKLLDITVFDIHAEYLEEPEEEPFPEILKQLQHKHYTIKLLLTDENVNNNSAVYKAVDVLSTPEISANHSPGKAISTEPEDRSMIEEFASPPGLSKTPQTELSTTKKMRTRKSPESVPFDQLEKPMPRIKKIIKTEKVNTIKRFEDGGQGVRHSLQLKAFVRMLFNSILSYPLDF